AVGLTGWLSDTRYQGIRIYSLGTPWKGDILDMAERQIQKGHYGLAMGLFQEVIHSYPDADRLLRATKGYETAAHRESMVNNLEKWRHELERAWPGASFEIRLDNDGLTVEASNAGIASLEPLRELPISNLYCANNQIDTLDPLRGMPLRTLNCSGNPVKSLAPLQGMPLTSLICEGCQISSLAPLQGLPLTLLNCGGNRLDTGLEPLRGMALTFLGCWGNQLTQLDPIQGMPLTALYCGGNQITRLDPLVHMPLNVLHCSGNRIASLEPLEGTTLTALHCSDNAIENLQPLKGLPLTMFSCHSNRISDMRPLQGMPLGWLTCGRNPLTSLEPHIDNPPEMFLFASDSLSDKYLLELRRAWAEKPGMEQHVRQVDVILGVRRRDIQALKNLAVPFQGKRYLYNPYFLSWQDARVLCEELGGHLLTIHSREENEFITSLFPGGGWLWLGLFNHGSGPQWVTGEPYDYHCFTDVLRERLLGPKIFNGFWTRDDVPNAHNCFMMMWDEP
ncbi:MAG: lectin-like protein, partial [Lentisphaerota bacterium]